LAKTSNTKKLSKATKNEIIAELKRVNQLLPNPGFSKLTRDFFRRNSKYTEGAFKVHFPNFNDAVLKETGIFPVPVELFEDDEENGDTKPPKLTVMQRAMLAERAKKYDPEASKEQCIEDLRKLQLENPDSFISRNFYRVNGRYSEKVWSRFFGTMEEYRSEAGLQLRRSGRQLEKHIAKHASLDESRKFYRLEIEPWVEKYSKSILKNGMKKMIIASDFHDIDVDLFCLSVFLETCRVERPDIIVLNGDIFDMYEFSRFDRDPRKINLKLRMEFVRDRILAPLRNNCPFSQIDLVIGNHEHRILKHLAAKTPDMAALMEMMDITLAQILGLDQFQVSLVSKGNTTAFASREIKEEMAKNFKVYFDTLVCNHTGYEGFGLTTVSGHTHRPAMRTDVLIKKGPINILTTGCMCKLDADYTTTKTNWQQSFAIAYVDPINERAQLHNVLFTDIFVNVNGRYYYRDVENTEIRDTQEAINLIKAKEIKGFVHNDEETAIVAGLEKVELAEALSNAQTQI
jgi:predicted phosphodiesterase